MTVLAIRLGAYGQIIHKITGQFSFVSGAEYSIRIRTYASCLQLVRRLLADPSKVRENRPKNSKVVAWARSLCAALRHMLQLQIIVLYVPDARQAAITMFMPCQSGCIAGAFS